MYSESERDYLHLTRDGVSEIIASYYFKALCGLEMIFNIESYSKINVEGSMWVTFIDMDTKEVLFTERLFAPPGGFGLRNYWAGAMFGVLEKIKGSGKKKGEFEMWRLKYDR